MRKPSGSGVMTADRRVAHLPLDRAPPRLAGVVHDEHGELHLAGLVDGPVGAGGDEDRPGRVAERRVRSLRRPFDVDEPAARVAPPVGPEVPAVAHERARPGGCGTTRSGAWRARRRTPRSLRAHAVERRVALGHARVTDRRADEREAAHPLAHLRGRRAASRCRRTSPLAARPSRSRTRSRTTPGSSETR